MGLDISGKVIDILGRDAVTTADTAYPSGTDQAQSVLVPLRAKGAKTHILVEITGASGSAIISVFGYLTSSGIWYWLDNLNNGVAIDASLSPIDATNAVYFAEPVDHGSAYDRLWTGITSLTGTCTTRFLFEGLHER